MIYCYHPYRYEDVQHRREADREKINQWKHAIDDAQSELEMLRARWKQLTDEEKRLNADNARIWEELQKARNVCVFDILYSHVSSFCLCEHKSQHVKKQL